MSQGPTHVSRFEAACAEGRWADAEAIAKLQLTKGSAAHGWAVSALARCAAARRDVPALRRWLDRARRAMTKSADLSDFHVLLLLQAGDLDGAEALLAHDPESDPAARLSGGTARALILWQRGRHEETLRLVDALLRRHAICDATPLAGLADHLVAAFALPGWVACQGGPVLTGLLRGDGEVRLSGPGAEWRWEAGPFRSVFGEARFVLPMEDRAGPWMMTCGGQALLGSGLVLSRTPVEGVVEIEGDRLSGWAAHRDDPNPPAIRITDRTGRALDLYAEAGRDKFGKARADFALSLAGSGLAHGRLVVTGGGEPLAGSPVEWEKKPKPAQPVRPLTPRRAPAVPAKDPVVDIIVPVHGDRPATLACLDRVLATIRRDKAALIVIDDATPDPLLAAALESLAGQGRITLLRNEVNLGFPASVNRGMALHPKRDVVLLNSDALVSGTWLRRLKAAATAEPGAGTATALSNEASICSYASGAPQGDWAAIGRLARRTNRGVTIELPTAVGFCMYIRRDCLRETGPFSETLFGRGYGEENDFCLRARALGWRHVAATDVYVGHVGGASFGAARALLLERNLKVLERRHPGYRRLIARFAAADPLAPARRQLDLARWIPTNGRPAVLLITLALEGGTRRHVEERRRALEQEGRRVLLLAPAKKPLHCRLIDPTRPELLDMVFDGESEIGLLVDLLGRCAIERIEIHHSLDHHPALLELPQRLGVPHDVVLHDYHWLCPQISLTRGEDGRYCGEPQPSLPNCETCLLEHGSESGEKITVAALRDRSARLLATARRVVAPSRDVAERYRRYFPAIAAEIRPWDSTPPPSPLAGEGRGGGVRRARIAIIGAMGPHKGFEVLRACALDAAARDLPLDFILIGYSVDDAALLATGRIDITGRYEEEEAETLIRQQQADCAFIPSIWPETWCYALSEAWRAGLPAAVFDLGTPAERIRTQGGGTILPHGASPASINDALLALATGFVLDDRTASPAPTQQREGPMTQSPSIAATPQEMTLVPGFYAVTVTRGAARARPGQMALPTVLISLPIEAEGRAEILSSHAGGWLTRQGDTVMLKVTGETPILLTSFKNPQAPHETLDIQFSRVDGPGAAIAHTAPMAPALPVIEALAHVQRVGDQTYDASNCVGVPGRGQAIEGFALLPKGGIAAEDIEYKAATANGWETPWMPGGQFCGTRGQAMPLIGLAVRLKGTAAQRFDIAVEAAFVNGGKAGPARNGAPCRSDVIGAPLDGFKLSFIAKA